MRVITFIVLYTLQLIEGTKRGLGPTPQDYGYVNIREGAHMFWWLFHTTANVTNSFDRPLILWHTGGPGGSSTGVGNVATVGPIDENLNERNTTWIKHYNVLFVDSPVGTGFSYVDSPLYLTRDNKQIAKDLVALMKAFYEELPQFKSTPFYFYGDGYGSKIGIDFIHLLYKEVQNGSIESNIKGYAAANSWNDPVSMVSFYAPYLYQVSLIDETGFMVIDNQAKVIKQRFDEGKFYHATLEWNFILEYIFVMTDGIDFSNIASKYTRPSFEKALKEESKYWGDFYRRDYLESRDLVSFMNQVVKEALNIPNNVTWTIQNIDVYQNLVPDFMLPVTDIVENILNETSLELHLVSGNLNLLTCTPGQLSWINKLNWANSGEFSNATRTTVWVDDVMEGYKKKGGGLNVHWINVAGLNIYSDNVKATREFLRDMTGF